MNSARAPTAWLLVLILRIGGCASPSESQLTPVTGADQTFESMSVSTLPPQGAGWYVIQKKDAEVWTIFFNQRSPEDQIRSHTAPTLYIRLVVERVDLKAQRARFPTQHDALENLRKALQTTESVRFREQALVTSYEPFEGGECLHFSQKMEERDNPQYLGKVLVIDTEGFACFHPGDPGLSVTVVTSRRGLQELPDPPIKPLHDAFVKNLVFGPVKGKS